MPRSLFFAALLLVLPAVAQAQNTGPDASAAAYAGPTGSQEIGPRLGVRLSFTDLSPGGLRAGGVFLYRLTDQFWFDSEAGVSIGSGDAACFYGRTEPLELICDHGMTDGFAFGLAAGGRYYLAQRPSRLVPYLRGGVQVEFSRFDKDKITGLSLPFWLGGGMRYPVSPGVHVNAEVTALGGPGWFDEGLGSHPQIGMAIQFGVEFML